MATTQEIAPPVDRGTGAGMLPNNQEPVGVSPGQTVTVDESSARRRKYQEIANSIGRPDPLTWGGVRSAAGWALAMGVLALLSMWVLFDQSRRDPGWEGMNLYGPGTLWLLILIATGISVLCWLVLFWRTSRKQRKEDQRKRKLMSIVSENPGFLDFYYGVFLSGFDNPRSWYDEAVQSHVGRNPRLWVMLRVATWSAPVCMLLSFGAIVAPAWDFTTFEFTTPGDLSFRQFSSLVLWTLAVVALAAWLVLSRRVEEEEWEW